MAELMTTNLFVFVSCVGVDVNEVFSAAAALDVVVVFVVIVALKEEILSGTVMVLHFCIMYFQTKLFYFFGYIYIFKIHLFIFISLYNCQLGQL